MSISIGTQINIDDPALDYFAKKLLVTHDAELSDIEISVIAREAAQADRRVEELRSKFAEVKSEWVDKIGREEKRAEDMRSDIARGKQARAVLCDQVFASGQIVSFDRESGIVIHVRAATPGEAQKAIPMGTGGGLLADAARAQKDAHVEEDEDGDVIPTEGGDEEPKTRRKRK